MPNPGVDNKDDKSTTPIQRTETRGGVPSAPPARPSRLDVCLGVELSRGAFEGSFRGELASDVLRIPPKSPPKASLRSHPKRVPPKSPPSEESPSASEVHHVVKLHHSAEVRRSPQKSSEVLRSPSCLSYQLKEGLPPPETTKKVCAGPLPAARATDRMRARGPCQNSPSA